MRQPILNHLPWRLALVILGLQVLSPVIHAQTYTVLKHFGQNAGYPSSEIVQGPDGNIYGTSSSGDDEFVGTVFKANTNGSSYTILKYFRGSDGENPMAGLVLVGNTLYGTTAGGGSSGSGTVFKLNTDGTGFSVLKNFATNTSSGSGSYTNSDGAYPEAGLCVSGSTLYGTAAGGGASGSGAVYKLNTDGTGFAVLKHFSSGVGDEEGMYVNSDGACTRAALILSGGSLYGTTQTGGSAGNGTVFKLNTDGTSFSVLKHFTTTTEDTSGSYTNSDGARLWAALTLSGDTLYGTTSGGGSAGSGTVFKMNADGTSFTVLKHFAATAEDSSGSETNSEGAHSRATLSLSGDTLYGTTYVGGSTGNGTVFKLNTDGTGFTVLKVFNGGNGATPLAGPTLSGNTLYGTTYRGGSALDNGTIFKVNVDGTGHTVLKHFGDLDGENPMAGLTVAGGTLYGTTSEGGIANHGTVFRVDTDGTGYSILKTFAFSDGAYPGAHLVLSGGTLYGTTAGGGTAGNGTVFKLNTDGTGYTVLKHFEGSIGRMPLGGVLLSGNTLYGTTYFGGGSVNDPFSYGTIFKVNTDGTGYGVLKQFGFTNGAQPRAGLVLSGNTLFGTTESGGNPGGGTLFKINTDGTGFALLKQFDYSDGILPSAGLTLSGSTLYGTARSGGSSTNYGTVFKVQTDGTGFSVIKNFGGGDGGLPMTGLVSSGNTLYGTTVFGGSMNDGTLFKINTDGTGFALLKHFDYTGRGAAELALSGNILYGVTSSGGEFGQGTLFALNFAPRFTSVQPAGDGSLALTLGGVAGQLFELYSSTNLSTWDFVAALTNETGTLIYTDAQTTNSPKRFYKAIQLP
jgi:uncharacterized repeat protein (TIGR03803 family)